MKLLLSLLLLPLVCLAQNNFVKVTAYRMVDGERVGHTTIKEFMSEDPYVGARIQAYKTEDETLAKQLIALKKEALSWERKSIEVVESTGWQPITPLRVPNMYVVQINRLHDTIYTTHNDASVFIPAHNAEYLDKDNRIRGLFDENLCFFAERDFKAEFLTYLRDSIAPTKVLLNDKPIYGHSRKSFEKNVMKFQLVRTDSIMDRGGVTIQKEYWINHFKMKFENKKLSTIDVYKINADYPIKAILNVGGIQPGDTEEKLKYLFPCSTEYPYWGARLSDLDREYYYQVHFTGGQGYAIYYIKDRKVNYIEISFAKE